MIMCYVCPFLPKQAEQSRETDTQAAESGPVPIHPLIFITGLLLIEIYHHPS